MSDLTGQVVAGRYRIDAFIASGGMGAVYKAWDLKRTTALAVKVLKPQLASNRAFLERFRNEADALARLQHPNIVRTYGMGQDRDLIFIIMDYIDGANLRQEMRKTSRPFPLRRVVEIMRGVCSALNYAHELGYVHCDVKPSNVILNANGVPLLSDFGIARLTGEALAGPERSGTPGYMAPELIRGEKPTRASDIYSLGVLLFEMLTGGQRPFSGANARISGSTSERVRWEQLHLSPPSLRQYHAEIPRELELVVSRCLDRAPENRYQNVIQLLGALEAVLVRGDPVLPASPKRGFLRPQRDLAGLQGRPAGRERAKRMRVYWFAVLAVLLVFGLYVLVSNSNSLLPDTPTSGWNRYTDAAMGFSIAYPPTWEYEIEADGTQVFFGSSRSALQSEGMLTGGAVVVVLRLPLSADFFSSSVDTQSPESLLAYAVEQSLQDVYRREPARTLRVHGYPAVTAVYASSAGALEVDQMYHWTVVVDGEMATMLVGITPEADWRTYEPVFEDMRDSLVP